jgi:PAS domain S-box-containing protein
VDINRAALAALGYAKEDVLDSEIKAMLISPEALMPKIKSAFNKKSPLELGEVNIHRRDGSHYLAHLRIRLFPVSSGKQQAAIFITDLTTKEEYRQQARQLEQRALLGEVTAVFAHEVRNPVNNISTTLQLMKSRLQGDEKSTEQIDRMLDNCQRLDQIMSSTLTFSRSTEFKMQTLAPKEMLESLLVRFQHKLTSESIKLAAAIPNDLPKIKGDAQALDQVFTNIITNAIQAMSDKEKKYLGVKAYKETVKSEEFLRIDITDSGPGIPEEKRQAIFQPFYTSKANGTGLGLTITQRIVNAHSGQIDVKSFEGGTIFYVRLPAIEE